jgi:hypothetical protein
MGFNNTTDDLMHHKAVTKSNQITSRHLGLCNLVPVFLFSGNVLLCEECRSALDNLPNNLEFTYQEDAQNSQLVSIFRRDAELWSEYGHAENYKSSPVSGRDDVLEISMSTSPRHDDPDVQAILQRALQTERESELWVWVDKCFSSRQWAPGFSVDEAVARARELASADAARKRISAMPRRDFVDGAIAGTAAAVICFSDAIEHQGWADTTIDKFLSVGEDSSGDLFGDSAADWHPKIYASYSLAWRIKSGRDRSSERLELFRLIMHPDDKISLAALSMVAECWEHDARYSWCGLNLGLRLAQLVRRRMAFQLGNEEYRQRELNNRDAVMTAAYEEYLSHGLFPSLVIPKPSWVQVSPQEESISCPGQNDEEEWQISDDLWDGKYAASVLQRFPVVAVMASTCRTLFVNATESFIHWTLDTINPPRRTDRSHRHELPEIHLYEWLSQLGWTVASVAAHLPADESMQKLLRPILAQPDVIAIRLLTPFTQSLVCDAVFDAQEIRDETLQLLHAVLERTLETREFIRSPHNDGRMRGSDLQYLIKSLLFIVVDNAPNYTRFANGNWKEIARVMPLVDHFVRTAGWHTCVAHSFILLCQSCGAAYPAEIFADQIIAQLVDGCLPSAWSHTIIPAAIAGLVQAHAERQHPLPSTLGRKLLQVLDALVDLGDRRSAAMQQSEAFRGIRNVV